MSADDETIKPDPENDLHSPPEVERRQHVVKTTPGSNLSNYRIKRYGWKPDPPDPRDKKMLVRTMAHLPSSADLRDKMPPVYDQGDLGSCTANAIAGAHEYNQKVQLQTAFTPSRLAIYYDERVIEGTVQADAGAFIRDGMKVVSTQGAASEALWPYDISRYTMQPPQSFYEEARKHACIQYAAVPRSLGAFKTLLAAADPDPIVFGFSVPENFESQECARDGMLFLPGSREPMLGGHAVLIVGYDDNIVFKRSGYRTSNGGFLVRNSWGPGWGIGGYFWMPYGYITNPNLSDDFWVLRRVA